MKKLFSILAAVIAVTMCLSVGVFAAPAVDGRKTIEAYIGEITIDGVIDDAWQYAQEVNVDVVKENASAWFGDSSKVAGQDYATMTAKMLWNGKDTVYFLFIVEDKLLSMVGANGWEKDSFEFFIQVDNEAEDSSAPKIQRRYNADGSEADIESDDFAIVNNGGSTYILEIAYDIEMDGFDGGAGDYIGVDFQYNDDAEGLGVRNVCLGWSDSVDKASSDCTVYGQALLSAKTVEDVAAEKAAAEAEAAAKAAEDAANAETPADGTTPAAPKTADTSIALFAVAAAAACVAGFAARRRK